MKVFFPTTYNIEPESDQASRSELVMQYPSASLAEHLTCVQIKMCCKHKIVRKGNIKYLLLIAITFEVIFSVGRNSF